MSLKIFIPKEATTRIEFDLVNLTERIGKIDPDLVSHGVLGGEFGYGADYENDTFMMHPFCWCEREDCSWCGGEEAPNFLHKPKNLRIWWYKWIGRDMEYNRKVDKAEWSQIYEDCIKSIEVLK